jgi:hypothetical protein
MHLFFVDHPRQHAYEVALLEAEKGSVANSEKLTIVKSELDFVPISGAKEECGIWEHLRKRKRFSKYESEADNLE